MWHHVSDAERPLVTCVSCHLVKFSVHHRTGNWHDTSTNKGSFFGFFVLFCFVFHFLFFVLVWFLILSAPDDSLVIELVLVMSITFGSWSIS